LRLADLEPALTQSTAFYAALGHYLGSAAEDKIPVIEGLDAAVSSDQLKALCAAAASAGAVAMFHAVGVTPEANSLEEAFGGNEPERIIDVSLSDLQKAWDDLSTAKEKDKLDLVVLGCPHFSFDEFRDLAGLIRQKTEQGQRLAPEVKFVIISCQSSYALAERSEYLDVARGFGAEITLDTCVFHTPMVGGDMKVIMTNSGKCAYYAPGELGVNVAFGTMADCVESAVAGCVRRKEVLWKGS